MQGSCISQHYCIILALSYPGNGQGDTSGEAAPPANHLPAVWLVILWPPLASDDSVCVVLVIHCL